MGSNLLLIIVQEYIKRIPHLNYVSGGVVHGNVYPMRYLWVFVLGPLVGASIAVEIRKKFHEEPRKNVRNCENSDEECEKNEGNEDDDIRWDRLVPVPRLIEKETEQDSESDENGQNFEAEPDKPESTADKPTHQENGYAKPEDADIIIQHDDKELQKNQNKETE